MVGQVTPIAINAIGWKFYLLFTITNFTNVIFFYCFLPETQGYNLEDMDELFYNTDLWVPGKKRWIASSHIEVDAERIAAEQKGVDVTIQEHA
jgi:hypothetical protein